MNHTHIITFPETPTVNDLFGATDAMHAIAKLFDFGADVPIAVDTDETGHTRLTMELEAL